MKNKYIFSVIMPIYNTEKYLRDSIDSVINQSIGFTDNIQLILVNDGSTDSSHSICLEYKSRFPENIIYIRQENLGAAQARNAGIPFIAGSYVNFFDSDDIWNEDAFEKAYAFFIKHKDSTDVVSCVQNLFEAKSGAHVLNDKFKEGSRIIDIHDTPHYIQLSTTSSFITATTAARHRFDPQLSIGEDAKFITEVILEKENYGVLADAQYNIRKRIARDSVTQNPPVTKYTKTIDNYYKYLPELSTEKYGKIIPYIQYVMINGLKHRAIGPDDIPLAGNARDNYVNEIISLIKMIDDSIILTTNQIMAPGRLYLLKLKYGNLPEELLSIQDNIIYFNSHFVGYMNVDKIFIDSISISDAYCTIEGHLAFPLSGELTLYALVNESKINIPLSDNVHYDRTSFNGDKIIKGKSFTLSFKLNPYSNIISFITGFKGMHIKQNLMSPFNKANISKGLFKTDNQKISLKKHSINIK